MRALLLLLALVFGLCSCQLKVVEEKQDQVVGSETEHEKTPGLFPSNLPDVKEAVESAGDRRNDPEWAWLGTDEKKVEEVVKTVDRKAAIVPPVGMHGHPIKGHNMKVYDDGSIAVGPVEAEGADGSSIGEDSDADSEPGIDGGAPSNNPDDYAGAPPVGMEGGILTREDKVTIRAVHEKLGHKLRFSKAEWEKEWPRPKREPRDDQQKSGSADAAASSSGGSSSAGSSSAASSIESRADKIIDQATASASTSGADAGGQSSSAAADQQQQQQQQQPASPDQQQQQPASPDQQQPPVSGSDAGQSSSAAGDQQQQPASADNGAKDQKMLGVDSEWTNDAMPLNDNYNLE